MFITLLKQILLFTGSDGEEILLAIIKNTDQSTAVVETKKIIQVRTNFNLNFIKQLLYM